MGKILETVRTLAETIGKALYIDDSIIDEQKTENLIEIVYANAAKLLKQSIDKYGENPLYQYTFDFDLVETSFSASCFEGKCKVLTPKLPEGVVIPKPLRNTNRVAPFDYVGTAGNLNFNNLVINGFDYTTEEELPYTFYAKYTGNTIKYIYMNEKIYILNTTMLKKVRVRATFESFKELNTFSDCCNFANSFLFPKDLEPNLIEMTTALYKNDIKV